MSIAPNDIAGSDRVVDFLAVARSRAEAEFERRLAALNERIAAAENELRATARSKPDGD